MMNLILINKITKLFKLLCIHFVFLKLFFYTGGLLYAQDSITVQLATNSNTPILDSTISRMEALVSFALNHQGVPYRYGGNNIYGLDCSGLICLAYKSVGIELPRTSNQQALQGQSISSDSLQTGDLIFFKGRSSDQVGHVALVSKILDGSLYIIHATSSRGVIEEDLYKNTYFMERWLFSKRID